MKLPLPGVLVTLLCVSSIAVGQGALPTTLPATDLPLLAHADQLINEAISKGKCPGAVLLVGKGDEILYRKAYGSRALQPEKIAATPETIYDLASLTKAIATAPSIIILADQGKLNISDKVAKYIPKFAAGGKQDITIAQLLLHIGGLIPDNAMSDYANGPAQAWDNICACQPAWKPGTHFAYSDVGYLTLGKIVEAVSGEPLDVFAKQHIFQPLKMAHTTYVPPASWRDLCAPTTQRGGKWIIGEVHDPRSYAFGGVAGHAGLFSTADDLAIFCRMLLHGGSLDGVRILKESTYREMIQPRTLPGNAGSRGYGFDIDTAYSGCRGRRFEAGTTFGHTGFTGTMFWVDPVHQCYVILLTNAVHPNGTGNVIQLRRDVATVVAEALFGPQK
jgi:CubicO group peptidase (beta-lactamase class C family)